MTDEEVQRTLRQIHQRFEAKLALIRQDWEQSLHSHLVQNLEEQRRELIRLLLERHEGSKQ